MLTRKKIKKIAEGEKGLKPAAKRVRRAINFINSFICYIFFEYMLNLLSDCLYSNTMYFVFVLGSKVNMKYVRK